jgi:hypothetical protein
LCSTVWKATAGWFAGHRATPASDARSACQKKQRRVGGPDGIAIVRRIVDNAGRHLTADAGLLCEVGCDRDILETTYPETRFLWLDSEESTGEVLWLDAAQYT